MGPAEPPAVRDVAERLSAIAEELADLALEQLHEASRALDDHGKPDPRLLERERRISRARRAVEKAVTTLSVHAPDE